MGFSKEKFRQIVLLMIIAAALVLVIIYSHQIFGALGVAVSIIMPFAAGGAIAFVLNIPMKQIENKLLGKWNNKYSEKLKRPVSIVLTLLLG